MLATLAAAVGLFLPGCGDDEPSGPANAEFVERADSTCDKWDARIDRAQGEQELAELIDGLFDELDSLPTPEGDEEQVDAIVASGRADLEALTRGEESEGEPFAEFSRLAAAYGLDACAASTRD
jgi:hypothetical protein